MSRFTLYTEENLKDETAQGLRTLVLRVQAERDYLEAHETCLKAHLEEEDKKLEKAQRMLSILKRLLEDVECS